MSTDWATSNKWSSLHKTKLGRSGEFSGQVRQSPLQALPKTTVARRAATSSELEARLASSIRNCTTVTTPATKRPHSAVINTWCADTARKKCLRDSSEDWLACPVADGRCGSIVSSFVVGGSPPISSINRPVASLLINGDPASSVGGDALSVGADEDGASIACQPRRARLVC
jgi:hypothetical protein